MLAMIRASWVKVEEDRQKGTKKTGMDVSWTAFSSDIHLLLGHLDSVIGQSDMHLTLSLFADLVNPLQPALISEFQLFPSKCRENPPSPFFLI